VTTAPLSASGISLRLVGVWVAGLILTIIALVGGAFLGPFLPEDDIVHCIKCLVVLGLVPFVVTCLLAFRVLRRSIFLGPVRVSCVLLMGYSTAFAVAATFANLIVIGSLLAWMFPT
jgi:hypothetical protein